jgi:hypothetical protein
MWEATVVHMATTLVAKAVIATRATIAIPDAISAYSRAVAPSWSERKADSLEFERTPMMDIGPPFKRVAGARVARAKSGVFV